MSNATFHYNWLLRKVAIPAVSDDTTTGSSLDKFGKTAFGKKFHGVYMRDEIPADLDAQTPYAIINLDADTDPGDGSHWIAVAFLGKRKGLLAYDSFGKLHETPKELTALYGKARVTDPDAEQDVDETNCGARCIAWLLVMDLFGAKEAKSI